jgi:2-polyprenyl-3-methyl-5-hydroxy-6-metoxy-1,4-benzoquinol methylase
MKYGQLTVREDWEAFPGASRKLDSYRYTCDSDLQRNVRSALKLKSQISLAELGCGGGGFCAFVLKLIGIGQVREVYGIDWSDELGSKFQLENISNKIPSKFYCANLLEDSLDALSGRFDVVVSGGLVEHFVGSSFDAIVAKHCQLASSDGAVILSVPNLVGLRYLWHRLFDYDNLRIHSLDAMRPEVLVSSLRGNGLSILLASYYGPNRIWYNSTPCDLKAPLRVALRSAISRVYNRLLAPLLNRFMVRWPSIYAPYFIVIATKQCSA